MNKIYISSLVIIVLFVLQILLKQKIIKVETFSSLNNNQLYRNNYKIEILNNDPEIILIKNFLTHEECNHIINIGNPHIKKSEVCGKSGSRHDKNRTSMTAHIGKKFLSKDKKDKVLLNVLKKAELYGGLPNENIEPIQLVRYTPGQYFKPHFDFLDRRIDMYKENIEKNGQREQTFFVYLNDVPDNCGGYTHFPKLHKNFKGNKGDAIFWKNVVNGEEDRRTLHSGTELLKGIKYGLNIWVREKKYIG